LVALALADRRRVENLCEPPPGERVDVIDDHGAELVWVGRPANARTAP
jgi:hypothetical protein